jgi:hypothetical protein
VPKSQYKATLQPHLVWSVEQVETSISFIRVLFCFVQFIYSGTLPCCGLNRLLIHSVQFHDQLNGLSFLKEPSCRFNGTVPEPRKDVRGGHIPGSKSVPYTEVLAETSRFLYYHGILVLKSLMT